MGRKVGPKLDGRALLAEDADFVRTLMRAALQEVLGSGEMTEAVGAGKGERFDGAVRTLSAFGAGAGGGAGGDVRARGFDPQS